MATSLPSDEVAEDYKGALEDLVTNDRYQIANLTTVAKENIEHAEAISRVLTNHINRAPPTRKLPALYVLDSLVKNIGSPYTVYFGRNLHQTFMLAYSQVDSMVRRKLEEMLRTWREPVPGSLSITPVFPNSSTEPIIDTLSKYRAATASDAARQSQSHASHLRTAHAQPYRNTPTPPQTHLPLHPHLGSSTPVPPVPQPTPLQTTQSYAPPQPASANPIYLQPAIQSNHAPPHQTQQAARPANGIDMVKLHADIDDLTTDAKIECATHPMDSGAQQKLITLQTLKEILESRTASDRDLLDIQNTIAQEMSKKLMMKQQSQPPPQISAHFAYAQPGGVYAPPAIPTPSFINQDSLAELLRATAGTRSTPQQPAPFLPPATSTLQPYHSLPIPPDPSAILPPHNGVPPLIPPSALPLLEQLRASGLLPATATLPPPMLPSVASQPLGMPSILHNATMDVRLTTASIKIPRPQLVLSFLNEKPSQCSTCGRRFTSDDIGKEKKARHLDWHFKTKARMIDAERRGQNRSWYVDRREWISMQEFGDDAELLDDDLEALNGMASSAAGNKKPEEYVRVPSDPGLRNAACPIDQEPFKSEWSEEVQDFIWKDAIRVGNRYYHASCYREATKDRDKDGAATPLGAGTGRTGTPDSVLGKRKAEHDISITNKWKIKLEA